MRASARVVRGEKRPAIVISVPLVWSVRNVLRSGLAELLERDFDIIYAVPPEGRELMRSEGVDEENIWPLEGAMPSRQRTLLLRVLRGAHAVRRPSDSDRVFSEWTSVRGGASVTSGVRRGVYRTVGRLSVSTAVFRGLERRFQALFTTEIPRSIAARIAERQPVAGLSTTCVVDAERPLFAALRQAGVPTLTHVLSFDNLTSRGYLAIKGYDRYLVWQGRMGGELQRFYDVDAEAITETGTPQFDFHVQERFRWTRDDTERRLGLAPGRRYFAYCANHAHLTPTEPELVGRIIEECRKQPLLADRAWVVRLHPMDRYARWSELAERFSNVVVSHPWSRSDDSRYWCVPSTEEFVLLGNTLRYADAALTVGSTTALDSAVVDTPIVCVGFHTRAGSVEDRFYHDLHFTHHYKPIMDSGATPLARDLPSLCQHLAHAVITRPEHQAARARLVADLCGVVDGKAAQRIALAVWQAADSHMTASAARRRGHLSLAGQGS